MNYKYLSLKKSEFLKLINKSSYKIRDNGYEKFRPPLSSVAPPK